MRRYCSLIDINPSDPHKPGKVASQLFIRGKIHFMYIANKEAAKKAHFSVLSGLIHCKAILSLYIK